MRNNKNNDGGWSSWNKEGKGSHRIPTKNTAHDVIESAAVSVVNEWTMSRRFDADDGQEQYQAGYRYSLRLPNKKHVYCCETHPTSHCTEQLLSYFSDAV